tara:strand:+ start:2107 stop:3342 length:1236 start_codon:yes stop_codon:yes gene_type:complete
MKSDNLVAIDLEIASTCNAACPVCIRRDSGVVADFEQQMRTLDDVKRIFDGVATQIHHIQLCGNYGDPMTCAEILPICEWFKKQNPYMNIRIATNGGIGKPEHYRRLGELGIEMIFGVDGASNEILDLHRVNVRYDRVLRNMTEYMSNLKKDTHNEWQYILFDENKVDLLDAIKQARQLGIKIFFIRWPNGFADQEAIPVYNFGGKFTHWLTPISDELKPWLDQHWDITKEHTYNNLVNALEKVQLVFNEKCHTKDIPGKYIPTEPTSYDGITLYDVKLEPNMITEIEKVDTQECYSLNFHNNSDLQTEILNVFVSHDNYVYPCCMVGSAVSRAKQNDYDGKQGHINDLLNVITENDYEKFSVASKSLKTVIDSGILHETYYNHLKDNDPNAYCKLTCGKCTGSRSAYQVK